METSVPQETNAARVGGDIATDVATAFGAQIQGHHQAGLVGDEVVQPFQDAASLTHQNTTEKRGNEPKFETQKGKEK